MDIAGVLLAAGSASRFGSDKLSHPLPDGTPIAVAAARTLKAALPRSIAVVRSAQSPLAALLAREGLSVVECADASEGMGRSLAAGVRASADAAGWIVALADMPFVGQDTITRLAAELGRGAVIATPVKDGVRGNPVGFSAALRARLEAFRGDAGARSLLQAEKDRITVVAVNDPGILRDIDRPADLASPNVRKS